MGSVLTEQTAYDLGEFKMLRLVMLIFLIMGCFGMSKPTIFNTEPYVDTVTDESGKKLLADTPRNWRDWTEIMDRHIQREKAGEKVFGGYESWNTLWNKIITAVSEGRQNAEKYVNYIILERRNAGLPELVLDENP